MSEQENMKKVGNALGKNPEIVSKKPWHVDDEFLIRDANGEIVADVSSKAYGGPHKDQRERIANAFDIVGAVNPLKDDADLRKVSAILFSATVVLKKLIDEANAQADKYNQKSGDAAGEGNIEHSNAFGRIREEYAATAENYGIALKLLED